MKVIKNKFILTFSLSLTCTSFLIAPINYVVSKMENSDLLSLLGSSKQNAKTPNDDVRLSYDNRNDDFETPNGVARIINDNIIVFNSWFNSEVWRYDLKAENTIAKKFFKTITSISNLRLKYNSYNNTFLVYGTINSNNTNQQFVIQINADNGTEFIVDNNYLRSIWSSSVIRSISNLVVDESNGNIIVIPGYEDFANPKTTSIAKFSSITYTNVWYSFSALNGNLMYRETNSIPVVFNVNENTWGFVNFIGATGNNNDKYQYLLFDYDLNFIAKSSEIELSSSDNLHSDKIIPTPLVFPFGDESSKKYKIIDSSIAPIYTLSSFNNESIIDNSCELRVFTFTPKNGSTSASISKENNMTTDYISYQLKKDIKNNAFYVSGFGKRANNGNNNDIKIDYSKNKIIGYKVNKTDGTITTVTNTLEDTYTSQKAVTNISIINDKNNKETKTALIKEVKIYGQSSKLKINDQINKITQSKYLVDISGSSPTNFPTLSSWNSLTKENDNNSVESLKSKLPSDVSEDSIKSLVKYKNGNDNITNVVNSLKILSKENNFELSQTKKILYNNSLGKLKAIVESNLKKWWYKSDDNSQYSQFIEETNIELDGFATINDLSFKLVTSSEVDSTKWNIIQSTYLGKVLPSTITEQNIIDNFIVKGGKINLNTSDITKTNLDNPTPTISLQDSTKKAINVLYSDQNGTLEIKYDLSDKSSPSMATNSVVGNHVYDGFLNSNELQAITIDQTKFNELKKKRLSNQFSVEDMLSVINAPNIYDTSDFNKWELKYANGINTENFRNDLINGQANFTFKYLKPSDFPTNIDETKYTIIVSSQTSSSKTSSTIDGNGTQKILDYIWDDRIPSLISFDQNQANILTGSKTLDEIKNNIDLILAETVSINNRWFETSQFKATLNNDDQKDKQVKFDLSFKDDKIISNINIIDNDKTTKKLVFDKAFRDELTKKKPNLFNVPQITFNYNLLNFNWKYGFTSNNLNSMELSFNELISKVNEERKEQGLELLDFNSNSSPTDFLKKLGDKNFNDYFPLISLNNDNSKNEPWYYELSKTEIIPNDENGTINIRYELTYPNLSTTTEVYKNPEVKLTGFKSKTFSNSIAITLISVFCFIGVFLIIFIPIIINVVHNKKINSNKHRDFKKALSLKYKKKVVKK